VKSVIDVRSACVPTNENPGIVSDMCDCYSATCTVSKVGSEHPCVKLLEDDHLNDWHPLWFETTVELEPEQPQSKVKRRIQLRGQKKIVKKEKIMTYKLCYVDDQWAYFTTQDLDKQWGDDWNDRPYEHNAGTPYDWREGNDESEWKIIKVAFCGDFESPAGMAGCNSKFCVQEINAKLTPWLIADYYSKAGKPLFAGVTVDEFKKFIIDNGGETYEKSK